MTNAVAQKATNNCGDADHGIPDGGSCALFLALVEHARDVDAAGGNGRFEDSHQESQNGQASEVLSHRTQHYKDTPYEETSCCELANGQFLDQEVSGRLPGQIAKVEQRVCP